jgi:excisionase family DNA binding protein
MYTIEKVAAQMHVSETTVLRWLKSGELRHLPANANKYAKRQRFLVDSRDLDEFIEQRKRGGKQPHPEQQVKRKTLVPKDYVRHYEE